MYFGFHSARPYSADSFTSLSENFHIVIFYGGFGGHCFVFEPESDYDPEFVLNGNPFGYFAPYADGQCRVISVNRTDFYRKGKRGCAANAETCFDFIFQSVKGGTDQCFISVYL